VEQQVDQEELWDVHRQEVAARVILAARAVLAARAAVADWEEEPEDLVEVLVLQQLFQPGGVQEVQEQSEAQ
jgi:hypothetical protein